MCVLYVSISFISCFRRFIHGWTSLYLLPKQISYATNTLLISRQVYSVHLRPPVAVCREVEAKAEAEAEGKGVMYCMMKKRSLLQGVRGSASLSRSKSPSYGISVAGCGLLQGGHWGRLLDTRRSRIGPDKLDTDIRRPLTVDTTYGPSF